MVAVLRAAGMRFVIYTDDHEPAHAHVYGDGEARINILDLTALAAVRVCTETIYRFIYGKEAGLELYQHLAE